MGFADRYIEKYSNSFSQFASEMEPMDMILVIPCYDEPDLRDTIQSLTECDKPLLNVGVVVVVNSSDTSNIAVLKRNEATIAELHKLQKNLPTWLNLFCIHAEKLPKKWAGVGWARKIGMDWAVSHFNQTDNKMGLIVSLDADCHVAKNYFQAIGEYFASHPLSVAATIIFEHCLDDSNIETKNGEAMAIYELYMRYYRNALKQTGFPNAIYTLGSCFAVKALAYTAMGGMNRKQAGEDFYFLHKLAQFGAITEIRNTTVYPSSRLSERVPFGTGLVLLKWINGDRFIEETYPLSAFDELRKLFDLIEDIFQQKQFKADKQLHPMFAQYLTESNFLEECNSLLANCSTIITFRRRFFHLFNAFRVLKWLNYATEKGWVKEGLVDQSKELLARLGVAVSAETFDAKYLLRLFRALDNVED